MPKPQLEINQKFIKDFEILIGQDRFRTIPPMLSFRINNHTITVPLKDFKKWIDDIVVGNGNRDEKSYKAFKNFKSFFNELLYPYIDYSTKEDK